MTPAILLYPNHALRDRLVTATDDHVRHIRITHIGAQATEQHAGARYLRGTICFSIPKPDIKPTPWQTCTWEATAYPVNATWHWDAIVLHMHEGLNTAFAGNRLDRIGLNADSGTLTPVESVAYFMLLCLIGFAAGCEGILTADMTADETPLPTEVVRGMWEHCEGGLYFVEGLALKAGSNDETDRLVICRELFGIFALRWIRVAEFIAPVTTPAGTVPRFVLKTRCP